MPGIAFDFDKLFMTHPYFLYLHQACVFIQEGAPPNRVFREAPARALQETRNRGAPDAEITSGATSYLLLVKGKVLVFSKSLIRGYAHYTDGLAIHRFWKRAMSPKEQSDCGISGGWCQAGFENAFHAGRGRRTARPSPRRNGFGGPGEEKPKASEINTSAQRAVTECPVARQAVPSEPIRGTQSSLWEIRVDFSGVPSPSTRGPSPSSKGSYSILQGSYSKH